MVIDTPGMREFGMWEQAEGISTVFSEIEALARGCRFQNCTHTTEPGCAVRAAIERGALDTGRLESYRKLQTESAYAADTKEYMAAKKEKFKTISKLNKHNKKR